MKNRRNRGRSVAYLHQECAALLRQVSAEALAVLDSATVSVGAYADFDTPEAHRGNAAYFVFEYNRRLETIRTLDPGFVKKPLKAPK